MTVWIDICSCNLYLIFSFCLNLDKIHIYLYKLCLMNETLSSIHVYSCTYLITCTLFRLSVSWPTKVLAETKSKHWTKEKLVKLKPTFSRSFLETFKCWISCMYVLRYDIYAYLFKKVNSDDQFNQEWILEKTTVTNIDIKHHWSFTDWTQHKQKYI